MAGLSNKERVGRVLDLVRDAFGPWVVSRLEGKFGSGWKAQVRAAAGVPPRDVPDDPGDVSYLLWVFDKQWHSTFRDELGFPAKRAASALRDARNEWAHTGRFTDEEAERALADGVLLLRDIGAVTQADTADDMRRQLRRIIVEKEQRRLLDAARDQLAVTVPGASGLPAWRDVVEPHDDVAQGKYLLSEFAADMRQVHAGIASAEYGDPSEFFERTFVTRGLGQLLRMTLERLNGVGGEPVIDLMTTFGGGKTHSQIAVYHLVGGTPVERLQGVPELCQAAGVPGVPANVRRAVIVGNDFSVLGSEKPDGTKVSTLWGEIAWQLGGKAGYEQVRRYDEAGLPPTTSDLQELLETFSPCVVLIDEWVSYLRQLWSRGSENPYPAGTFETHQTFAQSLTEAVKAVPTAMLVVSLPGSDSVRDMGGAELSDNIYEIGGTPGLESLRSLRSVIHRVETPWQPATVEESFEIVRRRIFKPLPQDKAAVRDIVVAKYVEHYLRHAQLIPSEALQPSYPATMKAAYPIHPEFFDRLYTDWSTLERFQRTRGVLRLMATVVHALWNGGDTSPIITPAAIPLEDTKVIEEITKHLDDPWRPVIDADIAGPNATAAAIDRDTPLLGRTMATRRAARCVFLGTAPAVNRNARVGDFGPVRGIQQKRVVLGATYPGDNPAHVTDALRQFGDRGAYMNRDHDRYWLSLQQTVSRIAQDRADGYDITEVRAELIERLRGETDRGLFPRVHRCPATTADVDDEPTAALVIFGMDRPFSRRATPLAVIGAREFLDRRGNQPRKFKNTLVFLAPDLDRLDNLDSNIRQAMSWRSVQASTQELNLDEHNKALVATRLNQAEKAVADTIRQTYRWILVPHQEFGAAEIEIEAILINGDGTLAARTTKKANTGEFVIREYAPALLRADIDRMNLWGDQPHVTVSEVANLFARYLYLPRVTTSEVIRGAVAALDSVLIADNDGFAYADSWDQTTGRYRGLVYGNPPAAVSMSGLIVSPDAANAQIEADRKLDPEPPLPPDPTPHPGRTGTENGTCTDTGEGTGAGSTDSTRPSPSPAPPPPPPRPTRFHATRELDPVRANRDMSQITSEIVAMFTQHDIPITVTVDLESEALARLDPDLVNALRENLRTLGFTDWAME